MSLKNKNKLDGSKVELEISIEREKFEAAVTAAFKKNAARMTVPGFRKGKAPRAMIERMYGKGVFYDEALNSLIPEAYESALSESGESPVSQPEFDLVTLEGEVVIKATFFVKPEVSIKDYKGIAVERKVEKVTEDEINAEIEQVRARNSRTVDVTDRAAANGDIAVIDYEGFVDGVAFDGGKGEKHNLKLGSGQFIPGFEDQIIGHNAGDAFDVKVTFPTEYHAKELAGKEAVFKTVLHEIKLTELPELDDEFAKDVSEFDTFAEYKADIKAKITERHNKAADSEVEEKLIDALIEKLEADIPEVMFANETEQQVRDYDNRLRMQGLDLETYLKYTGMDAEGIRAQLRPRAERQVKARLALEKIAELEGVTVTAEDTEAELQKIADAYGLEVAKVKEQITADMIADDIKVGKAVEIVKSSADVKKKASRAKKADGEAAEEKAEPKKSTAKKTAAKKAEGEEKAEPKKTAAKKTTKKAEQ